MGRAGDVYFIQHRVTQSTNSFDIRHDSNEATTTRVGCPNSIGVTTAGAAAGSMGIAKVAEAASRQAAARIFWHDGEAYLISR